jgi:hypothetical protein
MGFWKTEAGSVTGTQESAFTKEFKTIPDGSMALAKISAFKNDSYNGIDYLQITWKIVEGDFAGRNVFQKLKVFDSNEKAKLRALNMFMYLHKLFGIRPSEEAPTDRELEQFVQKIAGIKVRETEPNEYGKQYNWVSEVHNEKGFKSETADTTVVTHTNKQSNNNVNWQDDMPF